MLRFMETGPKKKQWQQLAIAALILCGKAELNAGDVLVYANPGMPGSSYLLEANGFVLEEFQPISRACGASLDRANITNVLSVYFAAQTPTNYHLYISLFESGVRADAEPKVPFGPMPDGMWLKGVYQYGRFSIADIRLRCVLEGKKRFYDLLLPMVRSNGLYYLTRRLETNAGICFWEMVRNHRDIMDSARLRPTNWTGAGYFAVTNYVSENDWSNPWVFWIPGRRLGNMIVTSNSAAIPKALVQPEDVAVAAIHALIANKQDVYLQLVRPEDIDRPCPWFKVSPAEYIKANWNQCRQLTADGAILCERVNLGESAYVTFRLVSSPCEKDWFYMRRYNGQWRLSSREVEDGNSAVVHFLRGTCVQRHVVGPSKVLPLP